ncbi:MAG: MlaD family protein, partial [Balneolales bacterium]|nr:MlaD family protein [Balneolales bacterium]
MKELSNEVKIGLVVLAAIIVAYFGFRIMQDEPLFSNVKIVNTKFANVDGLLRGSSVYLNGFKVGSVREMQYMPEVDSVRVVLSITEPIGIPVGSKAVLAAPGIIGSAVIEIEKSNSPVFIDWGSYIEGIQEEGLLNAITDEGTEVVDSVQVTLELVNELLRGMNDIENSSGSQIEATINNFKATTDALRDVVESRKSEIDSIIIAAENTLSNVSELSDSSLADIESMIANLEAFSNDLDSLSQNLQSSTNSLN